ncbi:MAG TPA: hypothetical protein VFV97_05335 [Rhodanobacteraceae bacterium]|nr:hypothetical protein [Rhodanobacteraceae bacterium]
MSASIRLGLPAFERRFFTIAAAMLAALVAIGFAQTFYLRVFFAAPALPWLVHVHGALITAWFALVVVQASLIGARRVDLHRRLGMFGAVLAAAIVGISPVVLVRATAREIATATVDPFWFVIFGVDTVILIDFAVLVGVALALRRRSDIHKRLMLLATASLLLPALARLPLSILATWILFYAAVLVPVATDTIRHRRLHPAFGWGALAVLASQQLAYLGTQTETWKNFTLWLLT